MIESRLFARGCGGEDVTRGKYKGNLVGDGTVLCPNCGGGYTNIYLC